MKGETKMQKLLIGLILVGLVSGALGLWLMKIVKQQKKEDEIYEELNKEFSGMTESEKANCVKIIKLLGSGIDKDEDENEDDIYSINVDLKFDEDGFIVEA